MPRGFHAIQFLLRLRYFLLAPRVFDFQLPQLALHPQRPRFRRPATAHHAALIRRAVRRHEAIRRILVRQSFGGGRSFHQVRGFQARQKSFCRRAQRIAEFHQPVEPRNHAAGRWEGNHLVFGLEPQIFQRVHKKCCAPAQFFAQHGNARSRVVECLHNHVFELFPQKLLDGVFVLLLHLGVIRQQSHRAEIVAFVCARTFTEKSFFTASAV